MNQRLLTTVHVCDGEGAFLQNRGCSAALFSSRARSMIRAPGDWGRHSAKHNSASSANQDMMRASKNHENHMNLYK